MARGATLDSGVAGGRSRLGVPLGDSGQINEARILLTIQEERTVGDETDMGVCAISNGVCAVHWSANARFVAGENSPWMACAVWKEPAYGGGCAVQMC